MRPLRIGHHQSSRAADQQLSSGRHAQTGDDPGALPALLLWHPKLAVLPPQQAQTRPGHPYPARQIENQGADHRIAQPWAIGVRAI